MSVGDSKQSLDLGLVLLDSCRSNMEGRLSAPWTEKLFKVLVIGDFGVGKTSIVSQYVKKGFSEGYKATIGVDFALKTIQWEPRTVVRLQLWDIAGECRGKASEVCCGEKTKVRPV